MATPTVKERKLTLEQAAARRGFAAQDHRASVAAAYRREDAGEAVERCAGCGCEVDIETAAHAPRCQA